MLVAQFFHTMAMAQAAVSGVSAAGISQAIGEPPAVERVRVEGYSSLLDFPRYDTPTHVEPITNGQVEVLREVYPQVDRGLFIRDTQPGVTEGFSYLFATGKNDDDVDGFEILNPGLLPPSLGIAQGQSVEDFMKQRPGVLGGRFQLVKRDPSVDFSGESLLVREIMPSLENSLKRYDALKKRLGPWHPLFDRVEGLIKRPEEMEPAMVDYWQAQALAQLFNGFNKKLPGQKLLRSLHLLSGDFYVDLPTELQQEAIYGRQKLMSGRMSGVGMSPVIPAWTKNRFPSGKRIKEVVSDYGSRYYTYGDYDKAWSYQIHASLDDYLGFYIF